MRWKLPSLRVGKEFESRQFAAKNQQESLEVEHDLDFDHNILFDDRFDSSSPSAAELELDHKAPTESITTLLPVSLDHHDHEDDIQTYGPGWRIEFRPLEVQLTDFENAAFAIFTVLLTRCIASQGHNFYMPISYVEENMRRAQLKDAAIRQKFWIRRNAASGPVLRNASALIERFSIPSAAEIELVELSMDEIFNGEQHTDKSSSEIRFLGLIPLVLDYINSLGCDDRVYLTRELVPYLSLLSERASGRLPTTARWIRNQLLSYQNGSQVITADAVDWLLRLCDDIGMGRRQCPELYGNRRLCSLQSLLVPSVESEPQTNNRTIIANLDEIEEEDLMFTNFTSYLRPLSLSEELKSRCAMLAAEETSGIDSSPAAEGSWPARESIGGLHMNETIAATKVTLMGRVKKFVQNVFRRPFFLQRKHRNREEKIRF
jgi:hypothetical protein